MSMLYHLERSDDIISVSGLQVPAKDGAKLRMLRYEPKDSGQNPPCLLFFHGGGFVYNASPHHFRLARTFAEMAGCTTLLVDYRLAPGYRFPTAAEDCFAVYRWVLGHADELGI
ncbi:MAG: alpha/beta hydrolase, partial [Anaerovoracaceae bacterium]